MGEFLTNINDSKTSNTTNDSNDSDGAINNSNNAFNDSGKFNNGNASNNAVGSNNSFNNNNNNNNSKKVSNKKFTKSLTKDSNKDSKQEPFSYEVLREGEETILRIDCTGFTKVPSIEEEPLFMEKAVEGIIQNPTTTKIIFIQHRDFEYDYSQIRLLREVALLYNKFVRNRQEFSYSTLSVGGFQTSNKAYSEIHDLLFNKFRKDPVGTYVSLLRLERHQRIIIDRGENPEVIKGLEKYVSTLEKIREAISSLELIKRLKPFLSGFKPGDREIYNKVFSPLIKPDFMFTKLMASYPKQGEEIDNYDVGGSEIVVFELENDIQYLYHVTPPEFKLDEEKYELLDEARNILSEHKPTQQEFVNPERMREVFENIGHDLLLDLADKKKLKLSEEEIEELKEILVRYTVGFGLIEVLLADPDVQDVTVNSPTGINPIFIVHGKYGECKTNIIPSINDVESWASKLRIMSGRPLDEADPVLDTEIEIPGIARARVAAITIPLNPDGVAYAFRRHRDKPWTLPLFIKNRMINPLAAGLISFIIDGNRTMLVAGTRSAGKSSLLGSMLVEIMRKYRIITIEDTLELPVRALRNLNYNIQPLKVAGSLSKGGTEVPADEGIRTTLRMGDSALIVGEVRSKEAKALYEAMRVGALANVVAGTIHGDSAYGVFDRVVNDLDVPRTSFKATDIIVVANPIRSADGLHRWRRVTAITEIRKTWEVDPLAEHGFVDLMKYDPEDDELKPTSALINGDSDILKAIAGNVKEWAGDWDAVWNNVLLRANIKEYLVKRAEEEKDFDLLEAKFVVTSNDEFHRISDKVSDKFGFLDSKEILKEYKAWFEHQIKKRKAYKETEEEMSDD